MRISMYLKAVLPVAALALIGLPTLSHAEAVETTSISCSDAMISVDLYKQKPKKLVCKKITSRQDKFAESGRNFEAAIEMHFLKAVLPTNRAAVLVYASRIRFEAFFLADLNPEKSLRRKNRIVRDKSKNWTLPRRMKVGGHRFKVQSFNLPGKKGDHSCIAAQAGDTLKGDGYERLLLVLVCSDDPKSHVQWLGKVQFRQ